MEGGGGGMGDFSEGNFSRHVLSKNKLFYRDMPNVGESSVLFWKKKNTSTWNWYIYIYHMKWWLTMAFSKSSRELRSYVRVALSFVKLNE